MKEILEDHRPDGWTTFRRTRVKSGLDSHVREMRHKRGKAYIQHWGTKTTNDDETLSRHDANYLFSLQTFVSSLTYNTHRQSRSGHILK